MTMCQCSIVFHCWAERHTVLVVLVRNANLVRPCIGDRILGFEVTKIEHDLETARLDVTIECNLRDDATISVRTAVEKGFEVKHVHISDAGVEYSWLDEVRQLIQR